MTKDDIRKALGYLNDAPKCEKCRFFKPNKSTDNFGPGDICGRNPDFEFAVSAGGVCKKFDGV